MPTYEYECKTCGHTFDAFQSMSDAPLKTCPQCGKEVRRLINGGTGIIFKGSGFYVTDKKSGGGTASKTETKPSETAASPAPETKTSTSTAPAGTPHAEKKASS
ncbi:FmdB family zinc ribbon protein [Breznakiellaceae bacterium SP9]